MRQHSRRKRSTRLGVGWWALLLLLLALLPSCGGGGGAIVAPPPPPPPPPPAPPPLAITTQGLPTGLPGTQYNFLLQATGGTPPYTWTVLNPAAIPAGMAVAADGAITGTPSAPLYASLDIQVRDAANRTDSRTLSITVVDFLRITNTTLPNANREIIYFGGIPITGGLWPYTVSLSPGSNPLPPGLTLDSDGRIRGAPEVEGNFSFTVTVSDRGSIQQTITETVSLFVDNQVFILSQPLPYGVIGKPYSTTIQVRGGTPPYSFSLVQGSVLPAGLTLDSSTGEISGIPSQVIIVYGIWISVNDSYQPSRTTSQLFNNLSIIPTINFQTSTLDDAALGTGYGESITVSGGYAPWSIRVSAGSLPPGVNLITSNPFFGPAQVSGTPTQLGQFSFTLEASDSGSPPDVVTRDFSIKVNPKLVWNVPQLPDALEGQPYSFTFQATDGVPPYSWFLRWCTGYQINCPPGLSLDSAAGAITGTPVFTGVPVENIQTTWSVEVSDSSSPSQRIIANLPMNVYRRLRLPSALPSVRIGEPVWMRLSAYGGVSPHTWRLNNGTLPAGLNLNSTGEIVGTPTSTETAQFTVEASDSGLSFPQTAQQPLSLTVVNGQGRNDTLASAISLSNGRYRASLSPYSDLTGGISQPDVDLYRLTAPAGEVVTVETFADRLTPPSPADTVIELLDSNGQRLTTCRTGIAIVHGFSFIDPCLDDDIIGAASTDSKIQVLLPGTPGTPVTFFVRVLDWRGDARPDFRYEISISGAN